MTDRYQKQSAMIGKILEIFEPVGIEPVSIDGRVIASGDAEFPLLINCMTWLIQEEILRVESCRGEGRWVGCRLTSKGMYLLGRKVEIGGKSLPMPQAVKQAQSGGWDAAKAGEFLGGLFSGAYKTMNS